MNECGYKFAYFMILDSLISFLRPVLPVFKSQETENQTNKEKHALDCSEHLGSGLWDLW